MCDPISIAVIGLAISSTTAVVSYESQKHAAQKANTDQQNFYNTNKQDAIDANVLSERDLSLRQSEDLLASGAAQQDVTLQEQGAKSTATVAAASAGITGNSVDAVLNDISNKASAERGRIQTNSQLNQDQIQRDKEGTLVDAQANINSVRQSVVRGPSILTPLVQIGGAVLNSADYLYSRNQRTTSQTPILRNN